MYRKMTQNNKSNNELKNFFIQVYMYKDSIKTV